MTNTPYTQFREQQSQRKQILTEAATTFIRRGTPVVLTKPQSIDPVDGERITDVSAVVTTLADNPSLNVAAVLGRENNLIAIRFERDSEYDADPYDLLKYLEQSLGPLPPTMTVRYSDKVQHKLFEYPTNANMERTYLDTGIIAVFSTTHSNNGLILIEGSEYRREVVTELTHSDHIAPLPEKWIQHLCTSSYEMVTTDQATQVTDDPVACDLSDGALVVLNEEEYQRLNEDSDPGEEFGDFKQHNVPPEEFLLVIVSKMAERGEDSACIMQEVMRFCETYQIDWSYDDLVKFVFTALQVVRNPVVQVTPDEELMKFIAELELFVFKDHHKELCCMIKPKGQIVSMSGKKESEVSMYLTYRMIKLGKPIPKDNALKSVIKGLEVVGKFEGDEIRLFNRVGYLDDAIYYDLGNENAVRITGGGWQVVECPPVFKRYTHQKVQVTPVPSGKLDRIFEFINHKPEDRLLISVYLVTSLIPNIPHPLLYVYGDHGGAKTSCCIKIKSVIDPSTTDVLLLNNKRDEIIRNLKQYYSAVYDNISYISTETSDLFCISSTGGGMDKRKLYTDEDSMIMSFKHCVILNGLKLAIKKPDLLDRTIMLRLGRLKGKYKTEAEINSAFDKALPEILGGAFDILAKAIEKYPCVKVEQPPRMADFAKWGYAVAEALGGHGDQFLEDYAANIAAQNDLLVQKNSLCQAVLELMEDKPKLATTIGKAFESLKRLARTDAGDRSFPSRDKELRPYLEELGPVLDSFGIRFEFGTVRITNGYTVTFYNDNPKKPDHEAP